MTYEDKTPKTTCASPKKVQNHWYVPCFDIKPHPKNAWQSPKNPLAHP